MKYVLFRLESKIKHPPYDFDKYCKSSIKNFKKFEVHLNKLIKLNNSFINDEEIINFTKSASIFGSDYYEDYEYLFDKLKELITELISYTKDTLNDGTYFQYLVKYFDYDNIEHLQESLVNIKESFSKDNLDSALESYASDDYTNKELKKAYDFNLNTPKVLDSIFTFLLTFKEKMIEQSKFLLYDYKPKAEDIETLYHATVYAKSIAKKGFSKNPSRNKSRIGLGWLGSGNSKISMTSNFGIARDASRAFKEMAMVIQNKVKWQTIHDWFKKEKIEKDLDHFGYPFPPENLKHVIELYRYYLSVTKLRNNPVFAIIDDNKFIKNYSKINIKDIGILKVDIDMTNPDIEYIKGEYEYRVPVEAVLKIKLMK